MARFINLFKARKHNIYMLNKRGKKAQFYLIAAAIIIALVISASAMVNYVQVKEKPKKFYDLSTNLGLEGTNLIKYGLYENKNIDLLIQNFTDIYAKYMQTGAEEANLIIISGNLSNITVRMINKTSTGDVKVRLGNDDAAIVYSGNEDNILVWAGQDLSANPTISLNFSQGFTQNYTLTPGQNFIFVLTKSKDFEQYVVSSETSAQQSPGGTS